MFVDCVIDSKNWKIKSIPTSDVCFAKLRPSHCWSNMTQLPSPPSPWAQRLWPPLDLPELPTAWKKRSNGLSGLRRKSRFDTNGMEPGTHNLRQAAQAKSSCTWSPPERGETRPNWKDSHLTFCPVNEDTKKKLDITRSKKHMYAYMCVCDLCMFIYINVLCVYFYVYLYVYLYVYWYLQLYLEL